MNYVYNHTDMRRILTHFSENEWTFDQGFVYPKNPTDLQDERLTFKPKGLWLSDETQFGWKQWCENEDFRTEHLKVEKSFLLDPSSICILDSDTKIQHFDEEYRLSIRPDFTHVYIIDWNRVSSKYKGILISPYSWRMRMGPMWYYGWDCASACIWDLSALTPLESSLPTPLNEALHVLR